MKVDSFDSWNIKKHYNRTRVNPASKTEDYEHGFERFCYEGENEDDVIDVEYTEVAVIPEKFILRLYNSSGKAVSHILSLPKINIRA